MLGWLYREIHNRWAGQQVLQGEESSMLGRLLVNDFS